jgi:hypothetical protein
MMRANRAACDAGSKRSDYPTQLDFTLREGLVPIRPLLAVTSSERT